MVAFEPTGPPVMKPNRASQKDGRLPGSDIAVLLF